MSAAAKLEAPLVQLLAVKEIQESPFNPRRSFDEAFLKELAADLLVRGMLQPILVRPTSDHFEVVFGAQRFRAAKLAKMKEVPVMVRDMDDQAALEAMLVENAKRQDIQPVEEADAYQQLHEAHGLSVAQIAKRVGRSKASVYARMKLTDLSPAARKIIHDKRVDASVALLAARMPSSKLQEKFLKDATTRANYGGTTWSFRDAQRHAREDYMVDLDEAQFDTKDPDLLAQKSPGELFPGPCRACPMRTGNQRDLFTDVKDGNVCTSPKCFRAKQDAHWSRVKVSAKREGVRILEGADAKKLFGGADQGYSVDGRSGYIDLHNVSHTNGRRYAELLKGKAVEGRCLARDTRGFIHELMTPADLHAALKEIGYMRLADEHLVDEDDGQHGHDEVNDDPPPMPPAEKKPAPKKKPLPPEPPDEAPAIDPPAFAHPKEGSLSVWCPFCRTGVELERDGKGEEVRSFSGTCGTCHGHVSLIASTAERWKEAKDKTEASMDRLFNPKASTPAPDKVWTKTYRDKKPKAEAKQPSRARPLSWDWKKKGANAVAAHAYAHSDPSVALCGVVLGTGGELPKKGDRYCDDCGHIVSGKDGALVTGVCSGCGCTDDKACAQDPETGETCHWVDVAETLCSRCAELADQVAQKNGHQDRHDQQLPASEVLSEVRRENKAKHRDEAKPGSIIDVQGDETEEAAIARHKAKRATTQPAPPRTGRFPPATWPAVLSNPQGMRCVMAGEIETFNKFVVASQGEHVVIMMPPRGPLSAQDALLLAAYLVAMAGGREAFLKVLDAVEAA